MFEARRHGRLGRAVGLAGVALLLLSSADCDPGTSATSPTPSASPNAIAQQLAREAAHPDPNFDFGFTVQVTESGFHPHWLVADCCEAITWKNLTNEPVTVIFDHQLVNSGPIPAGGSFSWKPRNVQSVAYHLGQHPAITGVVQVNQTSE